MNTNTIIAVIAIVLVAGGAYYWYGVRGASKMEPSADDAGTSLGMFAEENGIVITDQKPGQAITAADVLLKAPGFLVIHESDGSAMGAIIGASAALAAGENMNVSVTLTRAAKDGETLHAMLHADVDGNGTFDASIDTPVESALGGPIHASFAVSEDAEPVQVLP